MLTHGGRHCLVSAQTVADIGLAPLRAFHCLTAPCGTLCAAETCVGEYGMGSEGMHPYVRGLQKIGDVVQWLKK